MSGLILGGSNTAPESTGASDPVFETTTQTFRADVLDASMEVPVLVDFWAPWCGPCKQLTPVLEKAVRAAKGRVKLAKMNIDDHPEIAGQLNVQSIPAVFVFSKGQPVDGFMGAVPESQITALIEKVAAPAGPSSDEAALDEADTLLQDGHINEAAQIYARLLQIAPQNARAIGGIVRCLVATGDLDRARQTLQLTPPDAESDAAIVAARTALELAETAAALGDEAALRTRIDADPDDHQARYDLAQVLHAKGKNVAATDLLLEIIAKDRTWSDNAARKLLVQFFEAWGPQSDHTKEGRRRLSSLLFS